MHRSAPLLPLRVPRGAACDPDQARGLVKRRVGQRTASHGGRYAYRSKGLLDEIPRVQRIRG